MACGRRPCVALMHSMGISVCLVSVRATSFTILLTRCTNATLHDIFFVCRTFENYGVWQAPMRRVNEFDGDFRMFGKWPRLDFYNLIDPMTKTLNTNHFLFVGQSRGMVCGRRPCVAWMHSMGISVCLASGRASNVTILLTRWKTQLNTTQFLFVGHSRTMVCDRRPCVA
jgi:hypothetical protein